MTTTASSDRRQQAIGTALDAVQANLAYDGIPSEEVCRAIHHAVDALIAGGFIENPADLTPAYEVVMLDSAEALRAYLDALNESGEIPLTVGRNRLGHPFLISLSGPYAEDEHVLLDSPWQGDIDWSNGHQVCEECRGHLHGIDDLLYPVSVFASRAGVPWNGGKP